MAFGKRLQLEYKDVNSIDSRLEVWQEGFVGNTTFRNYADNEVATELAKGDSSSKRLPVVYGSQITLFFDAEIDYEFLDFFTSNSRKNKILFYKAKKLVHVSFAEADTWTESLYAAPYEVSLTGYDGLGLLKDEDFKDANKDPYEGDMTPLEILTLILGKTGLDLPINTKVSYRPSGASTLEDALTQVKKDVVIYRDLSCYEVLEQLFQGCRIFQTDGEWWVISNDNWGNDTISCFHYLSDGTASGTALYTTAIENWWMEGEGKLGYLPGLKQLELKQDYGYKANLLNNGNFVALKNGSLEGWTAVNTTVEQRSLDDKGNKYILIRGQEDISDGSWDTDNLSKYLVSQPFKVYQTNSIPTLSLSYALMGSGGIAHMYFNVQLDGDDGNRYTLKAYVTPEKELGYEWIQTNTRTGVPCSAKANEFGSIFNERWEVLRVAVEAKPYDEVPSNFKSLDLSIKEGIPVSGNLSILLFTADTADNRIAGTCFKDVGLKFTDENEEEFPTDTGKILINDLDNNYVPESIAFLNGDLPAIDNRLVIYDGGFYLNDGTDTPTTLWTLDNAEGAYTYVELVGRLVAAEMRFARQTYELSLADVSPGQGVIIEHQHNSNRLFLEAGITYNDSMNRIEGRYVELMPFTLDAFTVAETVNYEKSSGSSSSGSGDKLINTDERVGLMTENFEKTGPAGHLLDQYFETEVDTETGRILVRPRVRLIHDKVVERTLPIATGDNAIAIGEGTTADVMRQITLGSFNTAVAGSTDTWVDTDPLLIVGNGTSDLSRSDALRIYKSGYTTLSNALKIGQFGWGLNNPEEGVLSFDAVNGLRNYYQAAWLPLGVQTTAITWDTATGNFTLQQNRELDDLTINLDGRYSPLNHTHDDRYYTKGQVNALPISTFANDAGYITSSSLHSPVSLTSDDPSILSLTGQDLTFVSSNLAKLDETNNFSKKQTITVAGDGVEILKFNTERAWCFKQISTGSSSSLRLADLAGFKQFQIYDEGTDKPIATFQANAPLNFYYSGINQLSVGNGYVSANSYRISGTSLLLSSLKSGSIGAAGTFLKSIGTTSTPVWASLSSSDLSDHSNIAFVNTQNSFTEEQRIKKELPGQTLLLEIENTGLTGGSSVSVKNQMNEFFFGVDGAGDFRIRNQTNATTFFRADGVTNDIVLSASFDASSYLLSGTEVISSTLDFLGVNQTLSGSLQFVDASTSLSKDASNNLTFADAVTGTKTLAELAAGGASPWTSDANGINYQTGNVAVGANSDSFSKLYVNQPSSGQIGLKVNGGASSEGIYVNSGNTAFNSLLYLENYNSAVTALDVRATGEIYAYALPSATATDVLYYDPSTGKITHGAAGGGGGTSYTAGDGIEINSGEIGLNIYYGLSTLGNPSTSHYFPIENSTGSTFKISIADLASLIGGGGGTVYTGGTGINVDELNAINLDIASLATASPTSDGSVIAFYDNVSSVHRKMSLAELKLALNVGDAVTIQTRPVSTTAPSNGQALVWNGSQYAPTTVGGTSYWNSSTYGIYYNSGNIGVGTSAQSGYSIYATGAIKGSEIYRGSSRELKYDIQDYTGNALDLLRQTSICTYKLKEDGSFGIGFIAEDTHPWLSGEKQKEHIFGNHLGVLTKAIQEEDQEIRQLKQRVYDLENELKQLRDER